MDSITHPSVIPLVTSPTPPLHSSGRGRGHPRSHDVISDAFCAVYVIRDFGLYQEHHIVISQLRLLDRLRQAEAEAVRDIICPEVQSGGGRIGQRHGNGGTVWICPLPWRSGRVKHINITKFPIFLNLRGSKLCIMRRTSIRITYVRARSRCNKNMAPSPVYACP